MYQLPREFGSFNGLAVLCISVDSLGGSESTCDPLC